MNGTPKLNEEERIVYANGRAEHLTPKECGILAFLMKHPNTTISAEEIYRNAWDEEPFACRPIISVHVRHIREKIEPNPERPCHLLMSWGRGYRYNP